jgi:hypothetical protein
MPNGSRSLAEHPAAMVRLSYQVRRLCRHSSRFYTNNFCHIRRQIGKAVNCGDSTSST